MTKPLIVAHRGASHDAPENTLAAFRLGWEQGADAIEGDFHLTRDGHAVCCHDHSTQRTAGVARVIAECTLAELRALDFGAFKGPAWRGERIPVAAEVLATVPAGRRIYIELKCGAEILEPMGAAIRASGLASEQIVLIAFNDKVLAEAKRRRIGFKTAWLVGYAEDQAAGQLKPDLEQVIETLAAIRADGLDSHAHPRLDRMFVAAIRDAGYEFHVWTVDDVATAVRFLDFGVNSITTNRPGWIRQQLPEGTKS